MTSPNTYLTLGALLSRQTEFHTLTHMRMKIPMLWSAVSLFLFLSFPFFSFGFGFGFVFLFSNATTADWMGHEATV